MPYGVLLTPCVYRELEPHRSLYFLTISKKASPNRKTTGGRFVAYWFT
jgi:hypothetical protein